MQVAYKLQQIIARNCQIRQLDCMYIFQHLRMGDDEKPSLGLHYFGGYSLYPTLILLKIGVETSYKKQANNQIFHEFQNWKVENYLSSYMPLPGFYIFSRQTGALNRIIDRGSRAINYILTVMVFNVVPTILEVLRLLSLTVISHQLCIYAQCWCF